VWKTKGAWLENLARLRAMGFSRQGGLVRFPEGKHRKWGRKNRGPVPRKIGTPGPGRLSGSTQGWKKFREKLRNPDRCSRGGNFAGGRGGKLSRQAFWAGKARSPRPPAPPKPIYRSNERRRNLAPGDGNFASFLAPQGGTRTKMGRRPRLFKEGPAVSGNRPVRSTETWLSAEAHFSLPIWRAKGFSVRAEKAKPASRLCRSGWGRGRKGFRGPKTAAGYSHFCRPAFGARREARRDSAGNTVPLLPQTGGPGIWHDPRGRGTRVWPTSVPRAFTQGGTRRKARGNGPHGSLARVYGVVAVAPVSPGPISALRGNEVLAGRARAWGLGGGKFPAAAVGWNHRARGTFRERGPNNRFWRGGGMKGAGGGRLYSSDRRGFLRPGLGRRPGRLQKKLG